MDYAREALVDLNAIIHLFAKRVILVLRRISGFDKIKKMKIGISKKFFFGFSAAFFWAISIVVSRYVFQRGEDPYTMVLWTSLGAVPIWLYYAGKNQKQIYSLDKRVLLSLAVIGIAGSIGVSLMEVLALKYTTAINFSFLIRSVVVFTIFFAFVAFKEQITLKKLILVILTILGSFFLITKGQSLSLQRGDIFTLIEAAMIAFVNNILIKYTVSKIHPDFSAAMSFFIGLAPIIVFAYFANAIKWPLSWSVILIVVVCDVLLAQSRNRAYQLGTASFVTMMMSFTPVLVTLMAFLFLHESMTPVQLAGGILIVSAGVAAEKLKI